MNLRYRRVLKNEEGYPECGNASSKLRLTVTEEAVPAANTLGRTSG